MTETASSPTAAARGALPHGERPAPATPSGPETPARYEPHKEVRFAVVMYGGISLAIYMNGIAQELLSLVRATAPHRPTHNNPTEALYPDGHPALRGSAAVYREVARRLLPSASPDTIPVRFVVDIISGTSAGGLNGIFLAKALAREQSMTGLRDLWVEEGEIGKLLNDRQSYEGLGLRSDGSPRSLLNSHRMYARLLHAMHSMEEPDRTTNGESRLVDELDLYVTATDIEGLPLPIELQDVPPSPDVPVDPRARESIMERRHRNIFHFRYASPLVEPRTRNDFAKANNPFLAFAGRCTSAIVPAFEPMRLIDVKRVLSSRGANPGGYAYDYKAWAAFYRDYWKNAPLYYPDRDPTAVQNAAMDAFQYRAFGDGGYLDNKPFSHATEALARRRADLPVDRKLLYVEPDPLTVEPDPFETLLQAADGVPPDVLDHALAALSLPANETIRDDIETVRRRNELLGRIARIFDAISEDQDGAAPQPVTPEDGVAERAYFRLRVSAATDGLAELLRELVGLEQDSPYTRALRYLLKAWRIQSYPTRADEQPPAPGDAFQDQTLDFLHRFDYGYELRRHTFVQRQMAGRLRSLEEIRPGLAEAVRALKRELNDIFKRLSDRVHELMARATMSDASAGSLAALLGELQISLRELGYVLAAEGETARMERAREICGYTASSSATDVRLRRPDTMARVAAEIERVVNASAYRAEVEAAIGRRSDGPDPEPEAMAEARRIARELYDRYPLNDLLGYPIIYGTGSVESRQVDILRVSPLEATTLVADAEERRKKLAGVRLGHFGAFLDEDWRRTDILWGRLDGAERIICSLMPEGSERRQLIAQAQLAILADSQAFLGGRDDVLTQLLQLVLRSYQPEAFRDGRDRE